MHPSASAFVTVAMAAIAVLVGALFVVLQTAFAKKRGEPAARIAAFWTVAVVAWLAVTAGVASTGVFTRFDAFPPPFAGVLALTFALSLTAAFSKAGTRLVQSAPLWVLVLTLGYRLPLELVMHEAAREGTMPSVMSFAGKNFDIVSGVLGLVCGLLLWRGAPVVVAWIANVVGTVLLAVVVAIAVAATPTFAVYGPEQLNTWVAYVPFIWLPTVMVAFAVFMHAVIWRTLLRR